MTRRHHLIPVIPIERRRLSNQRCCPTATTKPGQRSAQALTRPLGFDRARLLDAKGFRAGGCGGLFPHEPAEYGRSNFNNDHNEGVSDSFAVCDRGSGGTCSCNARLLHSINSESIMAGRRSFISRSTSHAPAGIWLTSARDCLVINHPEILPFGKNNRSCLLPQTPL